MGVTIRCKKTNHSIDLGYFGFMHLRRKVAELQSGPFQAIYEEISISSFSATLKDAYDTAPANRCLKSSATTMITSSMVMRDVPIARNSQTSNACFRNALTISAI